MTCRNWTPAVPGEEQAALDAWVLATVGRAVAFARTLVHDAHLAEDLVQDCYFRLLRRRHIYDLRKDGTKLLYRAITNACINWTQRRKANVSLHDSTDEGGCGWPDPVAWPAEEHAMHRELAAKVGAGLAKLPPKSRAALELKAMGHSQTEVAEILGISLSHAGVLIHRARQALARHLGSAIEGMP